VPKNLVILYNFCESLFVNHKEARHAFQRLFYTNLQNNSARQIKFRHTENTNLRCELLPDTLKNWLHFRLHSPIDELLHDMLLPENEYRVSMHWFVLPP